MSRNWTEAEVQQLCSLVSEIPARVSDVERWKIVSKRLGTYSKGDCYRKYQEVLRAPAHVAVAEEKAAVVTTDDVKPYQDNAIVSGICSLGNSRSLGASSHVSSRPSSPEESAFLTSILSDGRRILPKSWTCQGIAMRKDRGFRWALRQWEGGPCGPLAVIQAHIVRFLMKECGERWREPSETQVKESVLTAMASILLRCASSTKSVVLICTLPTGGTLFGDNLPARHLFHSMVVKRVSFCQDREQLVHHLAQHYDDYTSDRGPGLLLFLASVLLTKGEAAIKSEMVLESHLIDRHGYAGQELVNLLIDGQATSCVFDEPEQEARGIASENTLGTDQGQLCGIKSQCDVGFLTVMEFFDYVTVGSRLKYPVAPIWVVCMESHYSVAMTDSSIEQESTMTTFDLVYYDQLEKSAEIIVLTLACTDTDNYSDPNSLDPNQSPPLELVLHTRWPNHSVDWNGQDPLL